MKVIIAGSRKGFNLIDVFDAMKAFSAEHPDIKIERVLSGTACGVDTYGEIWAVEKDIEIERFYGMRAGLFVRNASMALRGDALVALWDGKSSGTKHMIDVALAHGLDVSVFGKNGERIPC